MTRKEKNINEEFPDKHLMKIGERPWFVDMDNYKATKNAPKDYTWKQMKQFYKYANHYLWDGPYLFKISHNGLI